MHRLIAVTKPVTIKAPRRTDKPSPWTVDTTMRPELWMWLPIEAAMDLRRAHGGAICDVTPKELAMAFGGDAILRQRHSTFSVVPCHRCDGGKKEGITACPICKGSKRTYHA